MALLFGGINLNAQDLQEVTEVGNSTSLTISHAPGVSDRDSATIKQLNEATEYVEIFEIEYLALSPEEREEKNYLII